MIRISADRLFFYLFLLLVTLLTLFLIWTYMGSVVLALTVAVVLRPMHDWFQRRTGDRKGPATALTMITAGVIIILCLFFGIALLFESISALSADVTLIVESRENELLQQVEDLDAWLASTGLVERLQLEEEQISQSLRQFLADVGIFITRWLAETSISAFNLILPMIIFFSILGTLLTNKRQAVEIFKELSPMDNSIDQLFLDRMRIMTVAMMRSIVVIAVIQGVVTGLIMWVGGTPNIIPLTLLAILFSILPGGAALVGVPVGLAHIVAENYWAGALIIFGTITFVASLDNQVRPMLVSKDAYLNRAFVLLSVFSGIAIFGFMGVVYGPLIMILFTTTLEVYVKYYRPRAPEVTLADEQESLRELEEQPIKDT